MIETGIHSNDDNIHPCSTVRRLLELLFDFDSIAIRPPFDSHSIVMRPRYDHSTLGPTRSGLLHCDLNKHVVRVAQ